MDSGEPAGDLLRAAWQTARAVLDVLPEPEKRILLSAKDFAGLTSEGAKVAVTPGPPPPHGDLHQWALQLAFERRQAKSRRDFATADRIREHMRQHGFEIRDNKDGSVEVRRVG
jgi:cysteinyl-tRNA synthetase